MTDNAGLYLHIPFCEKRCRYCNFYSSFVTDELLDGYTEALIRSLHQWGGSFNRPIDTVYFGGGTPSLLMHRLPEVMKAVRKSFNILPESEITLEVNPHSDSEKLLHFAAESGINRLSVGAQSGNDKELKILGRLHTAKDTEYTVKKAREYGFFNISLDLIAGLPFSDEKSLLSNLDFISSLAPEHISSYMLGIEEKTDFFGKEKELSVPDSDGMAEQYLKMCGYFEGKGYSHYEISNFAKPHMESRHNLKYWTGAEYLGIGPSAHSLVGRKRFYYPEDLKGFISGNGTVYEGDGGSADEYVMLRLRLKDGVKIREYELKFGKLCDGFFSFCERFEKEGLMKTEDGRIFLTNKGFLVSNSIITELTEWLNFENA